MRPWRNTSLEVLQEVYEGVLYIEEWKDVKGYEGLYQVSTFGRVKSFVVSPKGRIRKGVPALGYPQVQLKGYGDGTFETEKIHRLVAKEFIPNPDNLPEVNHKKGDRGDCRFWMIEWSTPSDNVKHAYRELGKRNMLSNQKGETHYATKLKVSDILKIRELYDAGIGKEKIAKMFKQKPRNIYKIASRRTWEHVI